MVSSSPFGLLTRTLYRHLLRSARSFDRKPGLLSLLTLQAPIAAMSPQTVSSVDPALTRLNAVPLMSYSALDSTAAPDKPIGIAISLVSDAFQEWLGGKQGQGQGNRLFPPATPGESFLPMPLSAFVRQRVRSEPAVTQAGLAALYCAVKTLQSVQDTAETEAGRPQAAIPLFPPKTQAALRPLKSGSVLRPHCLLLEHPSVLAPGRAALLCFDISRSLPPSPPPTPTSSAGGDAAPDSALPSSEEQWFVRCYAVNRPFPVSVAKMTGRTDLGPFGDLTLFHGGNDGAGELSVIHPFADIPGAQAIDPDAADAEAAQLKAAEGGASGGASDGLASATTKGRGGNGRITTQIFVGGDIAAINERLSSGKAKPSDFKVVSGHTALRLVSTAPAGQGQGQGEGEEPEPSLALIDEDSWWLADGDGVIDFALLPAQFDTAGYFRDGKGLGANDRLEGYNHARFWHQNGAWAAAVRSIAETMPSETAEQANWRELLLSAGTDPLSHPAVSHLVASTLPVQISLPPVLGGAGGGSSQ